MPQKASKNTSNESPPQKSKYEIMTNSIIKQQKTKNTMTEVQPLRKGVAVGRSANSASEENPTQTRLSPTFQHYSQTIISMK